MPILGKFYVLSDKHYSAEEQLKASQIGEMVFMVNRLVFQNSGQDPPPQHRFYCFAFNHPSTCTGIADLPS
jgi:hypothetical protein